MSSVPCSSPARLSASNASAWSAPGTRPSAPTARENRHIFNRAATRQCVLQILEVHLRPLFVIICVVLGGVMKFRNDGVGHNKTPTCTRYWDAANIGASRPRCQGCFTSPGQRTVRQPLLHLATSRRKNVGASSLDSVCADCGNCT